MKTNLKDKTMNAQQPGDDFQKAWERRKQDWQRQAEQSLPNDATLLHIAELARMQAQQQGAVVVPLTRRRLRWLPYAAAASLVVGIATFMLSRQGQPDNALPVAEEVSVEGQTMHFLCNSGCSVDEVLIAANEVIKE